MPSLSNAELASALRASSEVAADRVDALLGAWMPW